MGTSFLTTSSLSHIAAVRAHAQAAFEAKSADFSYGSLTNGTLLYPSDVGELNNK
jgi:hypothetical protein